MPCMTCFYLLLQLMYNCEKNSEKYIDKTLTIIDNGEKNVLEKVQNAIRLEKGVPP